MNLNPVTVTYADLAASLRFYPPAARVAFAGVLEGGPAARPIAYPLDPLGNSVRLRNARASGSSPPGRPRDR